MSGARLPRDEPFARFPRIAAAIGGFVLIVFGGWAMVAPGGFYESIAAFDPYNAHFIQDIGAFQLGLAATLVLAAFFTNDALTVALLGVGLGTSAHVISHLLSLDSGGNPQLDVPSLSVLAVLLLVAGAVRWRRRRHPG
jgi:MYXO-CTERM domain-containing protein